MDEHTQLKALDPKIIPHEFRAPGAISADYNLCAKCAGPAWKHHCGETPCCGALPADWDGFRYPD